MMHILGAFAGWVPLHDRMFYKMMHVLGAFAGQVPLHDRIRYMIAHSHHDYTVVHDIIFFTSTKKYTHTLILWQM
jgi:hypothetical protein